MYDPVFQIDHFKNMPIASESIYSLWRKSSKTLGFFPKGAFEEYAQKNQIIVAINNEGELGGYLLYRLARRRVAITHLCVKERYRGNGLARLMFEELKNKTNDCEGVSLKCKRDYGVDGLWSRLGFNPTAENRGRGADGGILTYWWYDYGNASLFKNIFETYNDDLLKIAIDANIFYDFDSNISVTDESKSLLADWLDDKILIFLTPEIHNEINRCDDEKKREKERIRVSYFEMIPNYPDKFHEIERGIRELYPSVISEQDKSDIRQLSHVIAAGIDYFITRDGNVLKKAEALYNKYTVSVMRPCDLIINIDRLEREVDYKPARLAGTQVKIQKIDYVNETALANDFQRHELRETKSQFLDKFRSILRNPIDNDCYIIMNDASENIGLICYEKNQSGELTVPLIRAAKIKIEYTIIYYLVFKSILDSYESGNYVTKITDNHVSNEVLSIIKKNGFSATEDGFIKINLHKTGDIPAITSHLSEINKLENKRVYDVIESLQKMDASNKEASWSAEKLIWPGKLLDANIENFIVSIRPGWARELFDHELSNADLFGTSLELALNVESAYYRSVKNSGGLSYPSRILWYASTDSKHKSLGVRACSQLEEIVIGKPKELFNQFRRLGVYRWNDVYNLADKNLENKVMVLRFKNTEVFKNTVSYNTVCEILRKNNVGVQLLSPTKIQSNIFNEIYTLGTM